MFSGNVGFRDGSDRNHVSVVFTHETFFMFGNMVFHKLEGKPYLETRKRSVSTGIRKQFRKLQHPNSPSNTDFSKAFLSNGVFSMLGSTKGWYFQGMITPRTVLIRQSPGTPASRALISPRWCLSTNCGSSAPKNSRPSRPATATAREKEKAKADLQDWNGSNKTTMSHVNEMTRWYPLITSDFSDLLVLSTNLKLVYHAILIFFLKLRVGFGGKAQLGNTKHELVTTTYSAWKGGIVCIVYRTWIFTDLNGLKHDLYKVRCITVTQAEQRRKTIASKMV